VVELSPPGQRGRVVGTLLSALFLGILFGRLAGGLIADHLGWRWAYVLSAVLLAVLLPIVALRMPRMAATSRLPYLSLLRSLGSLLRGDAELRRIAAVQFLLGLCYGSFWATIAPMLALLHRLGPTQAGLMGIPGAAGAVVARPAGRWMDRSGAFPVVMAGVTSVFAAFAVMEFAALSVWVVVAGAILLDCGLRGAMVANQTQISSGPAAQRSRVNTIFGAHIWGGNAVGALLASTALAHFGWWAVCSLALVSASLAFTIQLKAGRKTR
jgi:predicted MFS family arabinose efflux permease